ncbi:MAG TPA: nuclear transport factor 2 family protein [Gammaproteobacteria bacterium]|nr:nuclear transport factor 2 family protein [Gammaproteobacteria bacterium]
MSRHSLAQRSVSRIVHAMLTGAAVLLWSLTAPALAQQVTMETLLDRVQIEDLLVKYYYDLASGRAHEMSEYFTEDALLDVDGTIAHGRAEIEKLYGGGARARDPNAAPRPHNGMLLTNPVIEVKGNRAQAHVIWTGVSNKGVGQPPSLYEQGREDTELVKVDGKWLISKRYISSDSGLPDRFDQTFKQRDNPLPPL